MQAYVEDSVDRSQVLWQNPYAYQIEFQSNLDTPEKALRYFEATELMDHGSQNFYLRMQTFDNPDYSYAQYLSDLRNTVGYRYVIHEPSSRPPLWIIHKQLKRSAGEREELVGVYHILHEMIWQASALGDIVQSRLVDAAGILASSLSRLSANLPTTSNRLPTLWDSKPLDLPPDLATQTTGSGEQPAVPATPGEEPATGLNADEPSASDAKQKRAKRKRNVIDTGPNYALARAIGLAERMRAGDGSEPVEAMTKEEKEADELYRGGPPKRVYASAAGMRPLVGSAMPSRTTSVSGAAPGLASR